MPVKRFPQGPCVNRPVFVLYPGPQVRMALRHNSHEAVYLPLETGSSREVFCEALEGRLIPRDFCLDYKIIACAGIHGVYSKAAAERCLIGSPLRGKPEAFFLKNSSCMGEQVRLHTVRRRPFDRPVDFNGAFFAESF